jgi:hypothetical protein
MIRKDDLEKYGYSAGCQGCKAILRGTTRQGHSEACRARLETELRDDPRMKVQRARQEAFVTRKLEESQKKRKKIAEEDTKDETVQEPGNSSSNSNSDTAATSSSPEVAPTTLSSSPYAPGAAAGTTNKEDYDADMLQGSGEKREGVSWEELAKRVKGFKKVRVEEVVGEVVNQECDDLKGADLHFDMKTGRALNEAAVKEARAEEIDYMKRIGLYTKCSIQECLDRTGKPPISAKWVDVDKGTEEKPDVRCRLVARDFKLKGEGHRDDLFASMPPLEAKKLLFRMAAATWKSRLRGAEPDKIMLIDVKKAHLNGIVGEEVWACIELPEEDYEEGMCGRLRRWLYGMRPAAKAWEDDYAEKLQGIGFVRGRAAPTAFYHPDWAVRVVVHGDDFTVTGKQQYLKEVEVLMREW